MWGKKKKKKKRTSYNNFRVKFFKNSVTPATLTRSCTPPPVMGKGTISAARDMKYVLKKFGHSNYFPC